MLFELTFLQGISCCSDFVSLQKARGEKYKSKEGDEEKKREMYVGYIDVLFALSFLPGISCCSFFFPSPPPLLKSYPEWKLLISSKELTPIFICLSILKAMSCHLTT